MHLHKLRNLHQSQLQISVETGNSMSSEERRAGPLALGGGRRCWGLGTWTGPCLDTPHPLGSVPGLTCNPGRPGLAGKDEMGTGGPGYLVLKSILQERLKLWCKQTGWVSWDTSEARPSSRTFQDLDRSHGPSHACAQQCLEREDTSAPGAHPRLAR